MPLLAILVGSLMYRPAVAMQRKKKDVLSHGRVASNDLPLNSHIHRKATIT